MKFKYYIPLITATAALGVAAVASAGTDEPGTGLGPKVQGIPYFSTFPDSGSHCRQNVLARDFIIPDEGTELGGIGNFSLDSIKNWSGEGAKRAGLIIQWNTGRDKVALAFGYRFDGSPTGIDMLRCVVENNPQLYGLFQRTNVSSGNEKFGYTINGIGWDANCSGLPVSIVDTGNGNEIYTSYSGFFEHPRGCSESVSYPDYDYDNWRAAGDGDLWQAGWYQGYWSYWLKDGDSNFSYSGVGASGRTLNDGSWDGWNYQPDMQMYDWMPIVAVPSLVPEGYTEVFTIGGITYKLKDALNAQVISGSTPYSGDIIIPASVTTSDGTFTVSSIGREAFAGAPIRSVSIPSSVGTIESKAFSGSTLSEIVLPKKLTTLKDSVFAGCPHLKELSLDLPELTEIPAGAFAGTALTSVVFPNNMKSVMSGAFRNCASLTEVTIPASLKQLSAEAFAGCDAIERITVFATTPLTISSDVWSAHTTANATLMVPEGFEDLYAAATGWGDFAHMQTHLLDVNIGDCFLYNGVPLRITSLEPATAAVTYNQIEGSFRETAVQVANGSLSGDLTVPTQAIYMGRSFDITEIDPYSFYYATKVTSVTLPDGISGIGAHLFEGCSKATRIVLPAGTDCIPDRIFSGCSALTEIVNLPTSVDTIGEYAFNQCSKLTSIPVFSEGLKTIGRQAFFNTGITDLSIPASVDSIGYQAFANTKITSVELPATVSKLGSQLFYQCRSLVAARLADGFTEVPDNLFYNCSNLTSVEIPEGVVKIGDYAFYGCSKLKATLPTTVVELGKRAFGSNTALTEITLPQGLRVIGDEAFRGCTSLTAISLPSGIKTLGTGIFYGCTKLKSFDFPNGISEIPARMFYNCSAMTRIGIPPTVKTIGSSAFSGCTTLEFDIPEGIEELADYAFQKCKAIKSLNIPASLRKIGGSAFQECTGLPESIVIPETVTSLGGAVIQGTNVHTVYVCDPKATTAFDYTFRTVSSWSAPVFCDVVVPYGLSDNASALAGYEKAASVTEPILESATFDRCTSVPGITEASISADLNPSFTGQLPERFAEACRNGFDENAEVAIIYSLTETYASENCVEAISATTSDPELSTSATAVEGAPGHFLAILSDLSPNSLYTYRWHIRSGDSIFESEPMEFTTLYDTESLPLIVLDTDAPVELYTLTGEYAGSFDKLSGISLKGIFIAVQSGKSFKISID